RARHRELRVQIVELLYGEDLLAARVGGRLADGGAQRAAEETGDELVERLGQRGRAGQRSAAGEQRRAPPCRARTRAAGPPWPGAQCRARRTGGGAGSGRAPLGYWPPPIFQVPCSRTSTLVKRTSSRTGRSLCLSTKRSRRVNDTATPSSCGVMAMSVSSTVSASALAK